MPLYSDRLAGIPAETDYVFVWAGHRSTGGPHKPCEGLSYQFPAAEKDQSSGQVVFDDTNRSTYMTSGRSYTPETLDLLQLSPAFGVPQTTGTMFGQKRSNENSAMQTYQHFGTPREPKSPSFANESVAHHTPDRMLEAHPAECSRGGLLGERSGTFTDSRTIFSGFDSLSLCSWIDVVASLEHDTRSGLCSPEEWILCETHANPIQWSRGRNG